MSERSLVEDLRGLRVLVADEDLSDVILRGNDGVAVPAARLMLAARSDVFKKMFFGNFAETRSEDVGLNYSGVTLRAMVHFCFTDELKIVHDGGSNHFNEEERARELVRLVSVAHYLDIHGLHTAAVNDLCATMQSSPESSCAVFDQCWKEDSADEKLVKLATLVIQYKPEAALLSENVTDGGVCCMDTDALSMIIGNDETVKSSIIRFNAVRKWLDGANKHENQDKKRRCTASGGRVDRNRRKAAVDIAKRIDLTQMMPSQLANVVEPSGLVSDARIAEAFKTKALEAEASGSAFGDESSPEDKSSSNVVVVGAGISEANGIYRRKKEFGQDVYAKKGVWDNKEVTFTISYEGDDEELGVWELWIESPSCPVPIDLYNADAKSYDTSIVPIGNWEVRNHVNIDSNKGVAPGPVVMELSGKEVR